MNPPTLPTELSAPQFATLPPDCLARNLAALMDDLQRTKEWFNAQMDAQVAGLLQLRTALNIDKPACTESMATLYAAPNPLEVEEFAPQQVRASAAAHPAVILPPSKIMSLDPELEQATLRELNDALSSAFAEISSRGGMLV